MAKTIEARVRQKAATIADWNTSTLTSLDGEQLFVRSNVDDKVIAFKLGTDNKLFTELEYPDFSVRGKVNTSSSWVGAPSGVYIPIENGVYNGVTVDLTDGYQVLYWDGTTLDKVIYDRIIDVIDNLTTDTSYQALSAKQGKVLQDTKEDKSNKSQSLDSSTTKYPSNKATTDGINNAVSTRELSSNKSQEVDESTVKYPSNYAVTQYIEKWADTFGSTVFGGSIDENYNLYNVKNPTWFFASPGTYDIPTIGSVTLTDPLTVISKPYKGDWGYTPIQVPDQRQMLVYKTMQDMRDMSEYDKQMLQDGIANGATLLGYYGEGDTPSSIDYYYTSNTGVDDGGSFIIVGDISLESKPNNVVYFGAKGDGVTNDWSCFNEYCNYINKTKSLGKTIDDKSYYIDGNTIILKTNFDFGSSSIYINDSSSNTSHVFKIEEDYDYEFLNLSLVNTIKPYCKKGTLRIPELVQDGIQGKSYFVSIYNANKKQFIRLGGTTGLDQQEHFNITQDGTLLNFFSQDFEDVTSIRRVAIDENKTYITGGKWYSSGDSIGETSIDRGISIHRSNTIVNNISHFMIEDGTDRKRSNGFVSFRDCGLVSLLSSNFTPRMKEVGSYEINLTRCSSIYIDSVVATSMDADTWGQMVSNCVKDLVVTNSSLTRVDSHEGVQNLTIDRCTIGKNGITVVGFGKLKVTNSSINSDRLLQLRRDYGTFWDGDIYFDNIDFKMIDDTTRTDFTAFLQGVELRHVFGFDKRCFGDKEVSFTNIRIDATTVGNKIGGLFNLDVTRASGGASTDFNYTLADKYIFKNISVNGQVIGKGLKLINQNGIASFKSKKDFKYVSTTAVSSPLGNTIDLVTNMDIEIDSVDFALQPEYQSTVSSDLIENLTTMSGLNYDDDYLSVAKRIVPNISIYNQKGLSCSLRAYPCILNVYDSEVRFAEQKRNGNGRGIYFYNNCIMRPKVTVNTVVCFNSNAPTTYFNSCYFNAPELEGGTYVTTSAFKTVYSNLKFGESNVAFINNECNMSNCVLDFRIAPTSLKSNLSRYQYSFGNATYDKKYYLKYGTLANRPVDAGLGQGFTYTAVDGGTTKLITSTSADGSSWVYADGTVVS